MVELYQKYIDIVNELLQSGELWPDEYCQLTQIVNHINGVWGDSLVVNDERTLNTGTKPIVLFLLSKEQRSNVRMKPRINELVKYVRFLASKVRLVEVRGGVDEKLTELMDELGELIAPYDALRRLGGTL
jgi:hypothetical protein